MTLYSYFFEQIYPRLRSEVDAAFALAKWFNGLDTGLSAYVSGTDMAEEYEVFVGQMAGRLSGFKSWQRKLDPAQVAAARQKVTVTLKRLGLAAQPELNCLLYHVEGL